MTVLYNTQTGRRVYRTHVGTLAARVATKAVALWLAEIAGVALLAVGAWLVAPALAFVIGGAYLILLGNVFEN